MQSITVEEKAKSWRAQGRRRSGRQERQCRRITHPPPAAHHK
uniref:Uncharacterized protein n=1 Tax=Arundo donax TaxID=35708 RepID=A0A0A8Z3G8_ARUDO